MEKSRRSFIQKSAFGMAGLTVGGMSAGAFPTPIASRDSNIQRLSAVHKMELMAEFENIIITDQFDFFGIGDLSNYSDKLSDYGYPLAEKYSKTISVGYALLPTIVDRLSVEPEFPSIELYQHFCYDLINQRLDNSLLKLSNTLIKHGYDALPIPATKARDNNKPLYGAFSHKAAANIAGLGWIGKSCLLITESVGPRARWGTILTNAPLTPTGNLTERDCGDCNICVKHCPAGAFTGNNFKMNESRENRYDAFKCRDYIIQRGKKYGLSVCGICVQVCPYGKKA